MAVADGYRPQLHGVDAAVLPVGDGRSAGVCQRQAHPIYLTSISSCRRTTCTAPAPAANRISPPGTPASRLRSITTLARLTRLISSASVESAGTRSDPRVIDDDAAPERAGLCVQVDRSDGIQDALDAGRRALLAVLGNGGHDRAPPVDDRPGRIPQIDRERPGEDGQPSDGNTVDVPGGCRQLGGNRGDPRLRRRVEAPLRRAGRARRQGHVRPPSPSACAPVAPRCPWPRSHRRPSPCRRSRHS